MSQLLGPGTIYVQNFSSGKSGELYTLNLNTGQATQIGKLATEVYDIAFVDTHLYGLAKKDFGFRKTMRLVKIDPTSGRLSSVGNTQFDVVGLAYNPVSKKLYATAHRDSQIVEINLNTGKATPVVTLNERERQCGELTFDTEGQAYITLIGNDLKKYLATCDFATGEVSLIGNIGFPGLASMKFIGNSLYGVTGEYAGIDGSRNGQIIHIDTATGQGTLIATTNPAVCWAGMAVYAATSVNISAASANTNGKSASADEQSDSVKDSTPKPQNRPIPTTSSDELPSQLPINDQETSMTLLTIDTKANCYVISPDEMNRLQQQVANSFTCEKGIFDIQIKGGSYYYSRDRSQGEPFVLLWIYGHDGNTFVNNNTGIEVGTTWTTLNGLSDRLQIDVKEKATICALFFDTHNGDNSGTVELSLTSNKPYFGSRTLTVDSQQNCYGLSQEQLSELQQQDSNVVELNAGNYRIKIRESNASYWSSEKKFDLEPWALLWLKNGTFVPKLTGVEVSETWCSLNGLQDELILEVKETTQVSGFFFDTFKDDNQGQITLEVEPISDSEVQELRDRLPEPIITASEDSSGDDSTSGSNAGSGSSSTKELVGAVSSGGSNVSSSGSSSSSRFNFQLDQSQIEETWQQIAQNVESSLTITTDGEGREAYWQNLEKGILKSYQQQAKEMAIKVARVEFMMKAFTQQIEGSFNQIFQGWSSYFDSRLTEIVDRQLPSLIEQQVNARFSHQTQEVKRLVVEQMQSEMEKRIEAAINVKLTQHSQEVKRLVVEQMQSEIEKRIETIVTSKTGDQTLEISGSVIEQIQAEMDKRIDAIVVLKSNEQSESLKHLIAQQIQASLDERVDGVVRMKLEAQSDQVKSSIVQQIQAEIDKRLDAVVNLKLTDQRESLKTMITRQVEAKLEQRIQTVVDQLSNTNVDAIINSITSDIDSRINANFENRILNFRQDVSTIVQNEINTEYTDSLKTTLLSDIQNQQFYLDMQSIKSEVMNFYARLGQFETQLNMRIAQGDARVYNWTLEQLTMLQGCITDRQTLADMLDAFSSRLRSELDETPCVQPDRFTSWVTPESDPQLTSSGTTQLPEGSDS